MNYSSIWPLFACLAVFVLFGATPVLSGADAPPSPQPRRVKTLDGIRGFLALFVFFAHSAVYRQYLIDGQWEPKPLLFYDELAQLGVGIFFMITAYLFWSRLIRDRGRIDWRTLYINRVFRIAPLFLFAFLCVLLIVMVSTGFRLRESVPAYLLQIAKGLTCGFIMIPDINRYPQAYLLLDGVTWTLRFEWLFYLSLPLLAIVTRRTRLHLPFVVASLLLCIPFTFLLHPGRPSYTLSQVTLFLLGMLTASLQQEKLLVRLPDALLSGLILLLAGSIFLCAGRIAIYPFLAIGAIFLLINSGGTVFGLLTTKAALRLGNISYGIYLLQGLAHALFFRPTPLRNASLASPLAHWALTLASGVFLILFATAAHLWIERPGIAIGKRIAVRLQSIHGCF